MAGPPRILLVTPAAPWPATTGARQRTSLLYRALSAVGTVDTFLLAGEPDLTDDVWSTLRGSYRLVGFASPLALSEIGWWRFVRPINPPLVNRLANVLQPARRYTLVDPSVAAALRRAADPASYDVVVTRYLHSAVVAGVLGCDRLVVDVDDLDSSLLDMRLASGVDPRLRRLHIARTLAHVRRIERPQLAACRHAWVAKPADLAGIGHARCSVLPNIPFAAAGTTPPFDLDLPPCGSTQTLLTVGMLNHAPNVQGIDAFLTESWPLVRRTHPQAEYRIVGSRLDPAARERWTRVPGVTVVGFVADLATEYARATATVCPIPWGGGTNIKVAESLAYGRPAVVSRAAHRGWETIFPDGEAVVVADDPSAFAAHVTRLIADGDRCRRMGVAGRAAARRQLSFAAFQAEVERTIRNVCRGGDA